MFNQDVVIYTASPEIYETDYFYRNGHADELLFIHKGKGKLTSMFGDLNFTQGDYIIIPKTAG